MDEGETLARSTQQVRRATQDVVNAMRDLGTGRDAMARDRLRRTRLLVKQCSDRVVPLCSPELKELRNQFTIAKDEFDMHDADAMQRERQTFRQGMGASGTVSSGAAQGQVRAQEIRPIDLSEFHTEESIQREKLRGVREIETNMMDLKSVYQEFHTLVHEQQDGIDRLGNDVAESHTLVERGHTELQSASSKQKTFRKFGCIAAIILSVVVVIVVIVVATTVA